MKINKPAEPMRLLRRHEVEALTGLATSSVYSLMSKGGFPKPIKLGPRTAAWVADEIAAWQAARIAARDSEVA